MRRRVPAGPLSSKARRDKKTTALSGEDFVPSGREIGNSQKPPTRTDSEILGGPQFPHAAEQCSHAADKTDFEKEHTTVSGTLPFLAKSRETIGMPHKSQQLQGRTNFRAFQLGLAHFSRIRQNCSTTYREIITFSCRSAKRTADRNSSKISCWAGYFLGRFRNPKFR